MHDSAQALRGKKLLLVGFTLFSMFFGAGNITISDRGIGLTAEEIDKYINQIAFSGANDFLEKI